MGEKRIKNTKIYLLLGLRFFAFANGSDSFWDKDAFSSVPLMIVSILKCPIDKSCILEGFVHLGSVNRIICCCLLCPEGETKALSCEYEHNH